MKNKERIPESLFKEDGDYLGRPADFDHRTIERRLNLVNKIDNFTGTSVNIRS